MRVLCVDNEKHSLRRMLSLCREMPLITEAEGFTDPCEALSRMKERPAELVLLDADISGTDGIAPARRIRERYPHTAIIVLSADPRHAVEAWELHATGYLLKPFTREQLHDELSYALMWRRSNVSDSAVPHIAARSFGSFDLIVDGKKLDFPRAKSKELLAFLIDRKGIWVSRANAFHTLWPDTEYGRPQQKQLDVIIRSLRATLREHGIDELLVLEHGMLRIEPQALDCDMYRLFAGDKQYEAEYQGEYMTSYSWANLTEGHIDSELRRRRSRAGEDSEAAGQPPPHAREHTHF